ncbi:MAG: 30S ribosomal protein S3 [Patescibacteria group bacterium]|nr:30S ribosomal protein S3 [Patescibacteria group bacterium]
MGHKVNPKVIRLGITRTWESKWFARKNYPLYLRQDVLIRKFIKAKLKDSGVAKIEIERSGENLNVIIRAARPGIIIGRGGLGVETIKKELQEKILNKKELKIPGKTNISINILEVDKPNLNAQIVVDSIIADTEKRVAFRRVMKQAISRAMRAGAKGVKVWMGGRLNGAEIARTEVLSEGTIPLHTLRADIDYSRGAAETMYGKVGVKVWIYRGEVFAKDIIKK